MNDESEYDSQSELVVVAQKHEQLEAWYNMSCHSENGKAKRPRRCLMNELLYDEDFKRNIADHYR